MAKRKTFIWLLSAILVFAIFPNPAVYGNESEEFGEEPGLTEENAENKMLFAGLQASDAVADWIFTEDYASPGTSIASGDLVITDASNNGNDLKMAIANTPTTESLSFTDNGGMKFSNSKTQGYYLTTVNDAPINTENFTSGFTIEAEFKLGPSINNWMGIFTRRGNNTLEEEPLSTLSISNIKEIQWASTPLNHHEIWSNWSNSLSYIKAWAQSEEFTHVAVVNDGSMTRMFVNGIESIRNPLTDQIIGLASEAGMGWNVGAYEWDRQPNSLFLGEIKRIRIMDRALAPSEFFRTTFNYTVDYGTNNDFPMFTPGTYTFAVIPDPQYVIESKPEILEKQLEFIASRFKIDNIAMTVNVGDSTQSSKPEEWESADKAFKILDEANAPYVVTRGNHDTKGTGYLDTFGPARFAGKDYFMGASPSGLSSYSIIKAGSYTYMFLAVDSEGNNSSNTAERNWAKGILDANPGIPTIIFGHDMLTINGAGVVSESSKGTTTWNSLVKDYDQVFMMIAGHISGAGLNVKQNTKGKNVLQVLSDYQSDIAGGNGWTSFFEFDERNDEIRLKTFSPYVAGLSDEQRSYLDMKFLTGPGDMYDIPFIFAERFDFAERALHVTEVIHPSNRSVAYGTAFNKIDLPATVKVKLSDATEADVPVVWQQGDYNALGAGNYNVAGTLTVPENIANPYNLTATLTVRVASKPSPGSSGGGAPSGGSGSTEPSVESGNSDVNATSTAVTAKVPAKTAADGKAKVDITEGLLDEIMNAYKENNNRTNLQFDIVTEDGAQEVDVAIPAAVLSELASSNFDPIVLDTRYGRVSLANSAIRSIGASAGASAVNVSLAGGTVGGHPVIDIAATTGKGNIARLDTGTITVAIPYVLQPNENPSALVVYFLDENGRKAPVAASAYDARTQTIIFTVQKFGKYAVGSNPVTFNDIAGHWAESVIQSLGAKSIVAGTGGGKFAPGQFISRAEYVKILISALAGSIDVSGEKADFTDVERDQWYSSYIQWAAEHNLVNGYSDGSFGPHDKLIREQMVVILDRFIREIRLSLPDKNSKAAFKDADHVSSWAADALQRMQVSGLIDGKPGNLFDPKGLTTRAEIAVIVSRLLDSYMGR